MEKKIERPIPFGKAARAGNFKLWRSRYEIRSAEGDASLECIHVSDLDGAWSVRIPETYEMFGILMSLYNDSTDELNIAMSAQAAGAMAALLSNMMYASVIGNGYFHRALTLVATLYANPQMLSEEARPGLTDEVRDLIAGFLDWRGVYEASVADMQPSEEDDAREYLAEKAMDILTEEGGN